jgi:pyroglutamyl-peptidase
MSIYSLARQTLEHLWRGMASPRVGHVRVFVTGFGPFAEAEVNPTQTLVESLDTGSSFGASGSGRLEDCYVVPVDCKDATDKVARLRFSAEATTEESKSASHTTVVMLHLGVFSSAREFRVERSAFNEATFRFPDASGRQPQGEPISADEDVGCCLRTTLDVDTVVNTLRAKGHPCAVSDDPGRYLCNWIYWLSLRTANAFNANGAPKESGKTIRSLFVHTPPFDVVDFETQKTFLNDLIHAVVDTCS